MLHSFSNSFWGACPQTPIARLWLQYNYFHRKNKTLHFCIKILCLYKLNDIVVFHNYFQLK